MVNLLRFRFCCKVFISVFLYYLIGDRLSTIGIKVMARKTTTTTKFEANKFNGKSNFLLWKMRVTLLLVKEGTHKALLGIKKKPSKMEDDEWNDIDFRVKVTIILCLSDEVLYNVMNEETTADFLCRLESLYMTKSLSNRLFMKKQYTAFGWRKVRIFYNISMLLIEF